MPVINAECAVPESWEIQLCDELRKFCEHCGLPFESADELVLRPGLTVQQRQWLDGFVTAWDMAIALAEGCFAPMSKDEYDAVTNKRADDGLGPFCGTYENYCKVCADGVAGAAVGALENYRSNG
jgi:hypothetical protein